MKRSMVDVGRIFLLGWLTITYVTAAAFALSAALPVVSLKASSYGELRQSVLGHAPDLDQFRVRGPFDVIFCRNVMIYFDKPTQLKILEKFAPLLDDGLLFVGHSESLFHAAHLFRLRGKTVYELAGGAR